MQDLRENTTQNPDQPLIIQIENTAFCNRKCPWCPQSKMEFSPEQRMSWDILKRLIDDLVEMNYVNRIHPYGNGEPLTDPELIERIKYIHKRLPTCHQYISTNGDLVDKTYSFEELFDAGLHSIQCNHYDDNNSNLKQKKINNGRLIHYGIGALRQSFYNRAGNVRTVNLVPSDRCWFPGRKLFFNYRGDMLVCCADWQYLEIVGNIKEQSLTDLLASPKLKKYQQCLDNRRSAELPLCSKCDQIKKTQEV